MRVRAIVRALRIAIFTITFLLFSSSCAVPPDDKTINIAYDPCDGIEIRAAEGTTMDELTAIDQAIGFWKAVANVHFSRTFSTTDQTLHIRFEEAALVFRGVYQDEVGDVIVNRRLRDPNHRAITVAHELGHALGLPHIDDRDSVMNGGNLELLPLPADVVDLGELWGPCVQDDNGPQSSKVKQSIELRTHSQL